MKQKFCYKKKLTSRENSSRCFCCCCCCYLPPRRPLPLRPPPLPPPHHHLPRNAHHQREGDGAQAPHCKHPEGARLGNHEPRGERERPETRLERALYPVDSAQLTPGDPLL